jgi:hypothetical protein
MNLQKAFADQSDSRYSTHMSSATTKLLSDFEALQAQDKQDFVREIVRRLPVWDSGELSDDVAAAAGDDLAAVLDAEERDSQTR